MIGLFPALQQQNIPENEIVYQIIQHFCKFVDHLKLLFPLLCVPIPGTKRLERVQENFGALQVKLTADDLAEIERISPKDVAAGSRFGSFEYSTEPFATKYVTLAVRPNFAVTYDMVLRAVYNGKSLGHPLWDGPFFEFALFNYCSVSSMT